MGTYSPHFNLYMPSVSETGWGALVSGNFSTIDTELFARVYLQATTPGSAQTGHLNITGTGRLGAAVVTNNTTTGTLNTGTTAAIGTSLTTGTSIASGTTLTVGTNLSVLGSSTLGDAVGDTTHILGPLTADSTAAISGITGIGYTSTSGLTAALHVKSLTTQLMLDYDASHYAAFTVASNGTLTLTPATSGLFHIDGKTIRIYGINAQTLIQAQTALTGSTNVAMLQADRGDSSFGQSVLNLSTGGVSDWQVQTQAGSTELRFIAGSSLKVASWDAAGVHNHYYDASNKVSHQVDTGGNYIIEPTRSITLYPHSPGTPDVDYGVVYPFGSYRTDLGAYNRKWRVLYAAELNVDILVKQKVLATVGGRIMVCPTASLYASINEGDTTIRMDENSSVFFENDTVLLEDISASGSPQFEWITLGNVTGPHTDANNVDYYTFNGCRRDRDYHHVAISPTLSTVGTAGSTTRYYYVVPVLTSEDIAHSNVFGRTGLTSYDTFIPSSAAIIATSNATLTSSNYVHLTWANLIGVDIAAIKIIRSDDLGINFKLVATLSASATSYNDQGASTSTYTPTYVGGYGCKWQAKDAVANTGGNDGGGGYIDLTSTTDALTALGDIVPDLPPGVTSSHSGPATTVYARTGTTWNSLVPLSTLGRLDGFVDFGSSRTFGWAVGNNLWKTSTNGFKGATLDATGGLRLFSTEIKMYNGATWTTYLKSDGNAQWGSNLNTQATTTFNIFSTAQTYGTAPSESIAAGSVMMGTNVAGGANLLFDTTNKSLSFRMSTTKWADISYNTISLVTTLTIGNSASSNPYMTFDSASGIIMYDSNHSVAMRVDYLGNMFLGKVLQVGSSTYTAGEIRQGSYTTEPTSGSDTGGDFTGHRIWRDSSTGVGKIAGYNSGTIQWQGNTDGKLYAAGGNLKIDTSGITMGITTGTGGTTPAYVTWLGAGSRIIAAIGTVDSISGSPTVGNFNISANTALQYQLGEITITADSSLIGPSDFARAQIILAGDAVNSRSIIGLYGPSHFAGVVISASVSDLPSYMLDVRGTFSATGAATLGSTLGISSDLTVGGNSNSFTGTLTTFSNNVTIHGILTVTGSITATTVTSGTDMVLTGVLGVGFTASTGIDTNLDLNPSGQSNAFRSRFGDSNTLTFGTYHMLFSYSTTKSYTHAMRTRHNSGAATDNAIDFYLWRQGTDASTAIGTLHGLTISANQGGSVGIGGVTSPSFNLDVTGTGRFTSTLTASTINGASITSTSFNSLSISSGTVTGGTFSGPTISGGSADNMPIGASTAHTGRFTTLNATSVIQLGGTSINTSGTLSNVAYLSQLNLFTNKQTITLTTSQLRLAYDAFTLADFTVNSAGDLTIAPSSSILNVSGRITPTLTTEQLRLAYDSSHYTSFITDSSGNFVLSPTSGVISVIGSLATTSDIVSGGNFAVTGGSNFSGRATITLTTEQLRLAYDVTHYTSFTVSSGGVLTLAPSGASVSITGTLTTTGKITPTLTTEQLRLAYDGSNYTAFTVSSAGNLTLAPSGGTLAISGALTTSSPILDSYIDDDLTITSTKRITTTLTTEQLRLAYNVSNYAAFTINSSGNITIAPTGGTSTITGILQATSLQNTPIGTTTRAAGHFTQITALFTSAEQLKLSYDSGNYATFTVSSAGNMTVAPTGTMILQPTTIYLNPSSGAVFPQSNYTVNLGAVDSKYLTLWAAELMVTNLVTIDTAITTNGRMIIGESSPLTTDVAQGDITISLKYNNMQIGDWIQLENNSKFEIMKITAGPTGTGPYVYTVSRDQDGTGANAWFAGDSVLGLGSDTDHGILDMYSLNPVTKRPLSHIYNYDSGGGSTPWESGTYSGTNYSSENIWTLFGDNAMNQIGDAMYFGQTANGYTLAGNQTPVWWQNLYFVLSTAAAYSAGTLVWEYPKGLAPPAISSITASSGGSLTATTTYWYVITSTNANGESNISASSSGTTTGSNKKLTVNWASVSGATGYKLYRGSTNVGPYQLLTTIGSGATVSYLDDGTITPSGSTPTDNTAFSAWTAFTPTFVGNTNGNFKATGWQGFEWGNSSTPNWCLRTINAIPSKYWVRVRWSVAPTSVTNPVGSRRVGNNRGGTGPTMVAWKRTGTTNWNDLTEYAAFGELLGLYGYGSYTAGFAAGPYYANSATATSWVAVDATNGFRIMRRVSGIDTQLAQWDISGNILVGQTGSGQSNVYISSGAINLRNNSTNVITLRSTAAADGSIATFDGRIALTTNGEILQGTSTGAYPTAGADTGGAFTGIRLWRDNSSGIGKIGGYNAGTLEWYGNTNGKLYGGVGNVWIDSAGLGLIGDITNNNNAITWYLNSTISNANTLGQIYAYQTAGTDNVLQLYANRYAGSTNGLVALAAKDTGGNIVELDVYATSTTRYVAVGVRSGTWTGMNVGALTAPTRTLDVTGTFGVSGATTLTTYSASSQPHCVVYNSTNQTITTNGVGGFQAVTWDSEVVDVGSCHSTVTNTSRITVPTGHAGTWHLSALVLWSTGSSAGYRVIRITKNGSAIKEVYGFQQDSARVCSSQIDLQDDAATAGDYYEVFVMQDSGGSIAFSHGGLSYQGRFEARKAF